MSEFVTGDPAEREQFQRIAADYAQYGGVTIQVVVSPDNPERIASATHIGNRAPCYLHVAAELMALAELFAERHATDSPCSGP